MEDPSPRWIDKGGKFLLNKRYLSHGARPAFQGEEPERFPNTSVPNLEIASLRSARKDEHLIYLAALRM